MATLSQFNPEAKRYPKQNFDWRKTHLHIGEGAAQSEPYARDAAMDDFSNRKRLHDVLSKACSEKGFDEDKAGRMHALLDRMLDSGEFPFDQEPEESESEEEPEEVDEEANVTKHEAPAGRISAKDSAHRSVAMDGGKCSACRIQDNHVPARKTVALDAAHNDMAQTVIAFWKQYGVNLQKVKP